MKEQTKNRLLFAGCFSVPAILAMIMAIYFGGGGMIAFSVIVLVICFLTPFILV